MAYAASPLGAGDRGVSKIVTDTREDLDIYQWGEDGKIEPPLPKWNYHPTPRFLGPCPQCSARVQFSYSDKGVSCTIPIVM
jgi:hypothetical protein